MDSTTWDKVRKDSIRRKELIEATNLPAGLFSLNWRNLSKTEKAKIEKASKGKGWFEEKETIVTKKGVETKAPIHHIVSVKKEHGDTSRHPIDKKKEEEQVEVPHAKKLISEAFAKDLESRDTQYLQKLFIKLKDEETKALSAGVNTKGRPFTQQGWVIHNLKDAIEHVLEIKKQKEQKKKEMVVRTGVQFMFKAYLESTKLPKGALESPKNWNDKMMAQDIYRNIQVSKEEAQKLVPQFRAIVEKNTRKEEIEVEEMDKDKEWAKKSMEKLERMKGELDKASCYNSIKYAKDLMEQDNKLIGLYAMSYSDNERKKVEEARAKILSNLEVVLKKIESHSFKPKEHEENVENLKSIIQTMKEPMEEQQ